MGGGDGPDRARPAAGTPPGGPPASNRDPYPRPPRPALRGAPRAPAPRVAPRGVAVRAAGRSSEPATPLQSARGPAAAGGAGVGRVETIEIGRGGGGAPPRGAPVPKGGTPTGAPLARLWGEPT